MRGSHRPERCGGKYIYGNNTFRHPDICRHASKIQDTEGVSIHPEADPMAAVHDQPDPV